MQTIGVLRGGPGREHEASLASGAAILAALPAERFRPQDIYIDRAGQWHERGKPVTPERALRSLDAALIALHGAYGEQGEIQKLLDQFGVPYAGSDSFASFAATHILLALEKARTLGLKTPAHRFVVRPEDAERIAADALRSFHQPVLVRPVFGSSASITAGGYAPMLRAIETFFAQGAHGVVIEEEIKGVDAAVGIIEQMRSERHYALPPADRALGIAPGRFHRKDSEELARLARAMHEALGLRHYSESYFTVTPRGIYYQGTRALPELGNGSLFATSLESVAIRPVDFFPHLVTLALA